MNKYIISKRNAKFLLNILPQLLPLPLPLPLPQPNSSSHLLENWPKANNLRLDFA